ncbi:hypothetical protein J1N35_011412 [Gossypium stocksii]|uniref:Uncharacterized protein n=1 Tax=Gossypium stocksii TaxID=47602 RepID=A0A9D3W2D5_9ROSI|nr:hypothetical protein J1N35_011412 [Gossypium stocksii]
MLEGQLKDLKDEIREKLKMEIQGLFEHYLGQLMNSTIVEQSLDKWKGILGGLSPGFTFKESFLTLLRVDLGKIPSSHNSGSIELGSWPPKLDCP